MDTQNLKAFQSVAEFASFSAAADALHLTQSAVSKRIATLEQQLNCRLFDRIGRTISLTEAGRTLLPRAKRILREVSDTQRLITDLSGCVRGHLKLATSHHIGLHHLPALLRKFSQQFPDVTLDLDFLGSEKASDAVLHGQVELAIVTLSPIWDKHLQYHSIWPDPLQFVAAPDHALVQRPMLKFEDLSRYPAILPSLNTYTTTLIKRLFDERQLPLYLTMATDYLETIKMMASIGLGWSVLPETIIDSQLTVLNIKGQPATIRELGCVYHGERSISNAARAFLQLLLENKKSK